MKGEPTDLLNFLSKLGLQKFYPNKLTLQSLLEINTNSVYDEAASSLEDIPQCFLRKLFKVNAECRNYTQLSNRHNDKEENDDDDDDDDDDGDLYTADFKKVNPLDLIVALFLCADSFLQQEMALKMSMCQFSVPLLLPHGNNSQCTLLLWALRDIVKEWRPHDLSSSKGFVEENIVQADIPCYAFVRLKNSSLSKSQILNNLLSRGQQIHNMFLHRDMEGGSLEKTIANGLVEVCWYLPCGTESADVFSKPIAFANLRGDIGLSPTQLSFLFHVSTATFVFLDKVEEQEHKILTSLPPEEVRSKLFLVVNQKDGCAKEDESVKVLKEALNLPKTNVKNKDRGLNMAGFLKKLGVTIKKRFTDIKATVSVVEILNKAVELGLCEDESKTNKQKEIAEKIVEDIGKQSIPEFKKHQLPLQGEKWKRLSQLEKEECRIKDASGSGTEMNKSKLMKEKQEIKREKSTQQPSTGMKRFVETLSTSDKEERDFFLKWMKFMLNTNSRKQLTELRKEFKEQCSKKNAKVVAELDQALMESSLGLEHYMREMGLMYEFSPQSRQNNDNIPHLPALAAEMLLDGYPLELLDGDSSNIPQKWVTDVLMELHRKVGEKSRLLVLTVLGVQSTGKSTLLNTMFGVQFPVSSGRCTRGAYMLFLRVGEDMRSQLNYDFIVLIDTEGLKSPDLAQLEDSYEHDNQLATFVIGLSDVTIINVAMENFTEMKDVLQIATHAFLRMNKIGKRPICHFVHQNVGGVSAHTKNMTERKHLLDQLNEMTQIAAKMERQPSIQTFTDIMDYDLEKNNWNIPGLWYGTPPMAPVNTGYSEAVAVFKRNLLKTVHKDKDDDMSQIPDFLEWMRSLWKAVKYENFIFSFRNTLVANAYDNLCKEFSQWEWEFRKKILTSQGEAELKIQSANSESQVETWNTLVEAEKTEVLNKIEAQKKILEEKLETYYRSKDKRANLIEKYKTDFKKSIESVANDIQHSVYLALDQELWLKRGQKEAQDILRKYRSEVQEHVMKLLNKCKNSDSLNDDQLTEEFKKMWTDTTKNVPPLKERDICEQVFSQLRKHFSNLKVNEKWEDINGMIKTQEAQFTVKTEHMHSNKEKFKHYFKASDKLQTFANSVIDSSIQFILSKTKTNRDYHESFTRELLEKVDECFEQTSRDEKTTAQFEIDLKIHICCIASRKFQEMHKNFRSNIDPQKQLQKDKARYLSDFLDLYKETDHCQRKAAAYVRFHLKPAVEDYIRRSLGVEIVDEILTSDHSPEYTSRSFFQYSLQRELLQKEDFHRFVHYIRNYETYVKNWIFQHVQEKISEDRTLYKLRNKLLQVIVNKITDALEKSTRHDDGTLLPDNQESIPTLINNMRKYLVKDISISEEDEKNSQDEIQIKCHAFKDSLFKSLDELKEKLQEQFFNSDDVSETLNKLPTKPQDELFQRVLGCGHQCPFCKVPCEAGGKAHKHHHAAVHRPQGLGMYRGEHSKKLDESLCTTDVYSERKFKNEDTKGEWHPYKDYTKYYPDWHIPPDRTIEASDYWKYVLVTYNDRFAEEYKAKPANIPDGWEDITKEQALKGLKETFNIK